MSKKFVNLIVYVLSLLIFSGTAIIGLVQGDYLKSAISLLFLIMSVIIVENENKNN